MLKMTNDKLLMFLDTEFTNLSRNSKLLSVGITVLSEKRESFYAEFNDFSMLIVTKFVKENVLPNMVFKEVHEDYQDNGEKLLMKSNTFTIQKTLLNWLKELSEKYDNKKIQFVVDVGTYDWLLFSELISNKNEEGQIIVPDFVDYIPIDLSTILHVAGFDTDVNRKEFLNITSEVTEHNALLDSKINLILYSMLMGLFNKEETQ
jgi:hypothetical protein